MSTNGINDHLSCLVRAQRPLRHTALSHHLGSRARASLSSPSQLEPPSWTCQASALWWIHVCCDNLSSLGRFIIAAQIAQENESIGKIPSATQMESLIPDQDVPQMERSPDDEERSKVYVQEPRPPGSFTCP